MPTYEQLGFGGGATLTGDRARAVFGHVMGLVALTMVFAALGAYLARNLNGADYFLFFLGGFACMFALNAAASRGREQLAVGLLFAMGLLLGLAISQVIVYYAKTEPSAVYQAAGSTALFIGVMGTAGYLTRRDLSRWARPLLWALVAVLVFGLIAVLAGIPGGHVIYCVAALAVFAGLTAFDFNRLARMNRYGESAYAVAPMIAAAIFLDIFNVFILLLSLFGGGGTRR